MNKLAFIFPGQGAQYVGMGKDFFEKFIQFVESNNWSFIGVTNEIINGEYIKTNGNKEK